MEMTRGTAKKVWIKDIIEGKKTSNIFVTAHKMPIFRARILGTIVDKFVSNTFSSITLDDSTATIRVKSFETNILNKFEIGDIVDVIGKIKIYLDEIYILLECIYKIENPNWEILRALEIQETLKAWEKREKEIKKLQKYASDLLELKKLAHGKGIKEEEVLAIIEGEEEKEKISEDIKKMVLELITKFDKGEGASYAEILENANLPEDVLNDTINELLFEGLCFEPKPGKIKKLS